MTRNDPPIDTRELLEIMDDDRELLKECLEDFSQEYPAMIKAIGAALETKDGTALEQSAHAFKGSLRYLAARKAAELAFQLERRGQTGEWDGADTVFASLATECERILAYIESV